MYQPDVFFGCYPARAVTVATMMSFVWASATAADQFSPLISGNTDIQNRWPAHGEGTSSNTASSCISGARIFNIRSSMIPLMSLIFRGAKIWRQQFGGNMADEHLGAHADGDPAVVGRQPDVEVFAFGDKDPGPRSSGSTRTVSNFPAGTLMVSRFRTFTSKGYTLSPLSTSIV